MRDHEGALARIAVVLMVVVFCALPTGTAADVSFAPSVGYSTGSNPYQLAIGDLNLDDSPDLAAGNFFGNSVSVLLGNGDGSFQAAVNHTAGGPVYCIAMGKLNGDDFQDLVVGATLYFEVWLGNGDGTFQAATYLPYLGGGSDIALEDLNGDDVLDVVTASGNFALVFLGTGDGAFQTPASYAVGADSMAVAIGLLNADAHLDLAVTNADSDNMSVLLGNGDGTFQTAVNYAVGEQPWGVSVGDLNEDGAADLVVANSLDGNLSMLLGNGDGTFQAAVNYGTDLLEPKSIGVGDLDGDGHLDMAAAAPMPGGVSVFLGKGDGTFHIPVIFGDMAGQGEIGVEDLNDDDKLDLVTTSFHGATISVSINTTVIDDGDGIAGVIDTLPDEYSNGFSDIGLDPPGTTSGTITNRGDQILTITDEANPSGVRIAADPSGGATNATVSVCGGLVTLSFGPGDEVIVTCGSAEMEAVVGPVEGVIGGEIAIVVPGGATATVTELIENTFQIENTGGSGTISVEYEGEITELNAGENTIIDVTQSGTCAASAAASTFGASPVRHVSDLGRHLVYLLLPLAALIGLMICRRKR